MKLSAVAENIIERILLKLELIPTPFLETHVAMLLSRTVAVAVKLGLFDLMAREPLSAKELAERCGTAESATGKLLDALVGAGYLRVRQNRYGPTRRARRWLLSESRWSLRDQVLWQFTEWEWLANLETFVRRGEPVMMHEQLSEEQWSTYQRGMRAMARILAPEVVLRAPVPKGARHMLDIGGSHGHFSAALCRHYRSLDAVVLDLPEAVRHAAPLLAEEAMGARVVHRKGDVRKEELGQERWDIIFMSQLVHHFDEATNREITRRVARALRPGGVVMVLDVIRASSPGADGQISGLYNLYFALTSDVGTWSCAEIASWQRAAGLQVNRPIRFLSAPGMGLQAAVKYRR